MKVVAKGVTFSVPDNATQEQISEIVDSHFSGKSESVKKKEDTSPRNLTGGLPRLVSLTEMEDMGPISAESLLASTKPINAPTQNKRPLLGGPAYNEFPSLSETLKESGGTPSETPMKQPINKEEVDRNAALQEAKKATENQGQIKQGVKKPALAPKQKPVVEEGPPRMASEGTAVQPIVDKEMADRNMMLQESAKATSGQITALPKDAFKYKTEEKAILNNEEYTKKMEDFDKQTKSYNQDLKSFYQQQKEVDDLGLDLKYYTKEQVAASPELTAKYDSYIEKYNNLSAQAQELDKRTKDMQGEGVKLDALVGQYLENKENPQYVDDTRFARLTKPLDNNIVSRFTKALYNSIIEGFGEIGETGAYIVGQLESVTPILYNTKEDQDRFVETAKEFGIAKPDNVSFEDWKKSLSKDDFSKIETKRADKDAKQFLYGSQTPSEFNEFSKAAGDYKSKEQTGAIGTLDKIKEQIKFDSGVSDEEIARSTFGGAILGLGKFLPTMMAGVGGAGLTALSAAIQSHASIMREMKNNPTFDSMSESDKYLTALPFDLVNAAFMSHGLSGYITDKGLTNYFVKRALGAGGEKMTATELQILIDTDIKNSIANRTIKAIAAGEHGFAMGAGMGATDLALKWANNQRRDIDGKFDLPKDAKEAGGMVLQSGIGLMIGSGVMAMPKILFRTPIKDFDNNSFAIFDRIARDPKLSKSMQIKYQALINEGKITVPQAKAELKRYNDLTSQLNNIPEDMSVQAKKDALVLLDERQKLQDAISGKDPLLVKEQQARIDEINKKLENVTKPEYTIDGVTYTKDEFLQKIDEMSPEYFKKVEINVKNDQTIVDQLNKKINAVQEPSTKKEMLPSKQPELGLREVGEGDKGRPAGESKTEGEPSTAAQPNVPEAVTPETKTEVTPEITDEEYKNFVDKGVVSDERIASIADKVKNSEKLSPKEMEIFTDKNADVEAKIKEAKPAEVTPEVKAEPAKVKTTEEIKNTPFEERTDKEHADYIKQKLQEEFGAKGVKSEEIDASIALMDANAEVTGQGDAWYRQIEDVGKGEFQISSPKVLNQKGLITLTENDVLKYKKIGVEDERAAQAMNQIGLSGVKFTKEEVNKKIKESLDDLSKNSFKYVIYEDSPAITEAIKFDINVLENDGASLSRIEQAKAALDENSPMRSKFLEKYQAAQEKTLNQWRQYLKKSEYSDAFKYLILDAVLTHNYDAKTKEYKKRNSKTIRNFTPFDAGSLAAIYNSKSKNLLKDYVEIQQKNINNIVDSHTMLSNEKGKWLKFDGRGTENELEKNSNKLSQLVQNTYWCTKTNAYEQLNGGDFYVYVTKDNQGQYTPRIAVRMEGDRVGEVRGEASSKQDLEAEMLPVADKFLRENIPNGSGVKWLNSIEYNTKVKEFTRELEDRNITREDINKYVEIIKDKEKFSVDYGENGLVEILEGEFRVKILDNEVSDELKGKIATPHKFTEDAKIFIGEYNYKKHHGLEDLDTVIGTADFRDVTIQSLGKINLIAGDLWLDYSSIKDLGELKTIGGRLDLFNTKIESLGKLESVGGGANFEGSTLKDLGELKTVGGDINFDRSEVESLGKLEYIGGTPFFSNSKVKDLGNLKHIKGYVEFSLSNIKDLGKLESIGGAVYLNNSEITSLGKLKNIGGTAYFNDSYIKDLGELKTIGGSIRLIGSEIESLGKLESIGRNAEFSNSKLKDLGELKTIGGNAEFSFSEVESLGKLESIGFDADFGGSKLKDLGELKTIGGNANFNNSEVESLGKLEYVGESLYCNFQSKLKDLGKLKYIGGDAVLAKSKVTDLGELKVIGGNAYFQSINITDLGKLEYVKNEFHATDIALNEQWMERNNQNNVQFQEAKGALETLKNGRKIIHALKSPDFSTLVHETAHIFEDQLSTDEKQTVQKWSGTKEWTTHTSETFARGFERYLRNGKAPSAELKLIFEKAKQWLTEIYSKLKGSPIEKKITPEVKEIFDRLLASEKTPEAKTPETKEGVLYQKADELKSSVAATVDAMRKANITEEKIEKQVVEIVSDYADKEKLDDVEREKLIREVLKGEGIKQKRNIPAEKITGEKPSEKALISLKDQIRLEAKAAKEGAKSVEQAKRAIIDYIKSVKEFGNITRADYEKLIKVVGKVKDAETLDKGVNKVNEIIDNAKSDLVEVSKAKLDKKTIADKLKSFRDGAKSVSDALKQIKQYLKDVKDINNITRDDWFKITKAVTGIESFDGLDKAINKINDIIDKATGTKMEITEAKLEREKGKAAKIEREKAKEKIKEIRSKFKDQNERRKQLGEFIRDMIKGLNLPKSKVDSIIGKVTKVNLDNLAKINEVLDYVDKVSQDAEYDGKLTNANKLRQALRKALKGKDVPANLKELGKNFLKVMPKSVEDINDYIEKVNNINKSIKGTKGNDFVDMVEVKKLNEYANQQRKKQDETRLNNLREQIAEITGLDTSNMTYKELMSMKEQDTGKSEDEINEMKQKSKDMFDGLYDYVKRMIETGRDPITDEPIDISERKAGIVMKYLRTIDPNKMTLEEINHAIDSANNFIVNGSVAKLLTDAARHEGNETAIEDAQTIKAKNPNRITLTWLQGTGTLPMVFEYVFGTPKRAIRMLDRIGINDMRKGSVRANRESHDITSNYIKIFNKEKPNGQKFQSQYNQQERGVLASLMRSRVGMEAEDFEMRKLWLEHTIEERSKGDKDAKKIAKVLQKVYDNIVKDSDTLQDVIDNVDPTQKQAVDHWIAEYGDKYDLFSDITEGVYNRILGNDNNYTPDSVRKSEKEEQPEQGYGDDQSVFDQGNGTVYTRESGILMKNNPGKLKDGQYIDYTFDYNVSNAMENGLIDAYTAEATRQIKAYIESNAFKTIIPDQDTRTIVKDRIKQYIRDTRNKRIYDEVELKTFKKGFSKMSDAGSKLVLTQGFQFLKQLSPLVSTLATTDLNLLKNIDAFYNLDKLDFMNRSNYDIGRRGGELYLHMDEINDLAKKAAQSNPDQVFDYLTKASSIYLKYFLIAPDVGAAKISWMAFYEKALKKQGIDPSKIDYKTHEVNKEAADYAQQMVDRQQNVSVRDLQGKLFTSRKQAETIVKNLFFTLANFRSNQFAREWADAGTLLRTDNMASTEDRVQAFRSLVGMGAEQIAFKAISIYASYLLGSLAYSVSGRNESEEDKKKRFETLAKGQITSGVTEPFSPVPTLDPFVQKGFYELIDKYQERNFIRKEDRENIFSGEANPEVVKSTLKQLGAPGILGSKLWKAYEISQAAYSDKIKDKDGNEIELDFADRRLLKFMLPLYITSMISPSPMLIPFPADQRVIIEKFLDQAIKRAQTSKQIYQERQDALDARKAAIKDEKAEEIEVLTGRGSESVEGEGTEDTGEDYTGESED